MMTPRAPRLVVPDVVNLPCLECGKVYTFNLNSHEANGVLNVF